MLAWPTFLVDRPADVSPRDTPGVLHRTFIGNVNSQVNSCIMFITLQALNNFYAAPCGRSRGGVRGNCAVEESVPDLPPIVTLRLGIHMDDFIFSA
jgi:hypothetical protein